MAKITSIIFSTCKLRPFRLFSSRTTTPPTPTRNTKVNFSTPDSDSDSESAPPPPVTPNPPPPYNPFNKTPVTTTHPTDPTNLQQVFHNIRTDGLHNNAVKMLTALSQDGLTHEALELFSQIKDKAHMPDVVAHTAVIEAYADAGKPKEALKVYTRVLASGVLPNAYTYSILIKALAGSGDEKLVREGTRCFVEMMRRNIRPNVGTCVAVFEGLVTGGKEDEGRELVMKMKEMGFVPDKDGFREVLKGKRGHVFRSVMSIVFGD
ncbi:uncharacterized protein LOC143536333 [Bidens hawaiensis]|uniref:uncharacterized protein LOC143536333 n=1 Tax=Bidens hawaiensis TaxID=980011 RepID=UPI00404B99A0